jgi:uncharacterized protein (DUF1697 family)
MTGRLRTIETMLEATVGAIVGAVIVAIGAWALAHRNRPVAWWSRRARARREARFYRRQSEALRDLVKTAKRHDRVVVVSATGKNPTRVKWDGALAGETIEYQDDQKYRRDLEEHRVPHLRTRCCGRPHRLGQVRPASSLR